MSKAGRSASVQYSHKGFRISFARTQVMGIVNVTPDSFSDGGKYHDPAQALAHARRLAQQGADIIDIGGESSRPGAAPTSVEEELARVIPVVRALAKSISHIPISIDTYKPEVAAAALAEGAVMINDISGLRNPAMASLAAKTKAPVVVMHMKGTPQNMQRNPTYKDVVAEVKEFFLERIKTLGRMGVKKIILDPGIGFGKTANHNLMLLNRLEEIAALGYPLLVGLSRKSFIGKALGADTEDRETGGVAANAIAIAKGARIIRVHDAGLGRQTAIMADCIRLGKKPVDRRGQTGP
ncbi:MAG: dihydropteroate synthase [Nitrospinota bacterium]|nr:dihydropteroate synthase [Nitrospinota bacterium]MDH5756913.1 dihydropteroate synthase [Nitrospinota bacterium]